MGFIICSDQWWCEFLHPKQDWKVSSYVLYTLCIILSCFGFTFQLGKVMIIIGVGDWWRRYARISVTLHILCTNISIINGKVLLWNAGVGEIGRVGFRGWKSFMLWFCLCIPNALIFVEKFWSNYFASTHIKYSKAF